MSEIGDLYKEWHEEKSKKRWNNLQSSTALLEKAGFKLWKYNNGIHLRVQHRNETTNFDFWPSTGLFINCDTKEKGRGVFKLIKALES